MTVKRKRGLLAATAAVALVGAGLAVSVTGQASAQPGSRLCGVFWHATDTDENVAVIYEVAKHGQQVTNVCGTAQTSGGGPGDRNVFEPQIKGKAWQQREIHMVTCEDFTSSADWLNGIRLTYQGDNWPTPPSWKKDPDICKNMNKSDTVFEMERYNLYDDGTHKTYLFRRN